MLSFESQGRGVKEACSWTRRSQFWARVIFCGGPACTVAPLFISGVGLEQGHPHIPAAPWQLHRASVADTPSPPTNLLHTASSPSTKLRKEFLKRHKKISDQELQMRQPKKQHLELISPWTVKPNCFQWVLTFLRIIKNLAVTFHKGPSATWTRSTCFPQCPDTRKELYPGLIAGPWVEVWWFWRTLYSRTKI